MEATIGGPETTAVRTTVGRRPTAGRFPATVTAAGATVAKATGGVERGAPALIPARRLNAKTSSLLRRLGRLATAAYHHL